MTKRPAQLIKIYSKSCTNLIFSFDFSPLVRPDADNPPWSGWLIAFSSGYHLLCRCTQVHIGAREGPACSPREAGNHPVGACFGWRQQRGRRSTWSGVLSPWPLRRSLWYLSLAYEKWQVQSRCHLTGWASAGNHKQDSDITSTANMHAPLLTDDSDFCWIIREWTRMLLFVSHQLLLLTRVSLIS